MKTDIQSRKLKLVEAFLRVEEEDLVSKLETVLKKEQKRIYSRAVKKALSEKQLNAIIDKAEDDSKSGRMKSVRQLKKDISSWQ